MHSIKHPTILRSQPPLGALCTDSKPFIVGQKMIRRSDLFEHAYPFLSPE